MYPTTVQNPSLPKLLEISQAFLLHGNLKEAKDFLARVAEESPESLRLQSEIALREGRNKEARTFCRKLLETRPLDGDALLRMAELDRRGGDLERAVIYCERAARVKGFEAPALILQAEIEVGRNRYPRAAELLQAALVFKDEARTRKYLEQVLRMTRP